MQYIVEGVILGLTLAILLGPIFIALTQTGIQHGLKAGISVGSGIWVSDVIVIISAYFFIKQIDSIANDPSFQFWMGMIGGIILIGFGIYTFSHSNSEMAPTKAFSAKSYLEYVSKGFAVNFFNPFTFVFWISVMSSYILGDKAITGQQIFLLFGSIMVTIIFTDTLKVVLAKLIRNKMTAHHLMLFSKIAGAILILFGVILLVRTNVI